MRIKTTANCHPSRQDHGCIRHKNHELHTRPFYADPGPTEGLFYSNRPDSRETGESVI